MRKPLGWTTLSARGRLAFGGASSAMRVLTALAYTLKSRSPANSHPLKRSFPGSEKPSSPSSLKDSHGQRRTPQN